MPAARSTPARRSKQANRRATSDHTLILLVRHGQTPTTGQSLPGRAPGLHLAESGIEQATAVAERIATLGTGTGSSKSAVAAVYASPLERTRETATPIAKAVGLKVTRHKGLLECDFGDWTGRSLAELRKLDEWKAVQSYPSGFRFPGGESFTEMQTRITSTLADLAAAHRGETIVAVSHADPIKAAVAHAMGTHLDLFQRIVISPCSVTALWFAPTGVAVLTVNNVGDLSSLALS